MTNPVGRPLLFKSPEELEAKINEWIIKREKDKKPFTLSSLAVHLDCDRHTLVNYGKDEEFFATIKRVKAICESWTEDSLYEREKPTAGVIFSLTNNFDWQNKQYNDNKNENNGTLEVKVVSYAKDGANPPA